ncbi:MAG: hypothetical protein WC217_00625 [Candidatus Paceibacterota bacterium]
MAKANREEEKKCGKRWKYVVPWHADADEPADPTETTDSFAAVHSDVVVTPGSEPVQFCPCPAPSSMCDDCPCSRDAVVEEDPVSAAEAKWL